MTITILIIVNVFSALAIIVLALMQQSKGDMGSAFGGGSSQSMFGSRGSANFLSRTTAVMCVVFFATSLSLAYMYAKRAEIASVVDDTSVIEQSTGLPVDSNEVPSINGIAEGVSEADASAVPAIGVEESALEAIDQGADTGAPAVPEQ